ncbi:hypothetical protein HYX10_01610 [Candidatus Woesearchaeota archaeon]|nr:hypothetical protein [Candidatus Woesearchaeota archaeon]
MDYVIGVDLDNTIVSYDPLAFRIASELNLVSEGTEKSKTAVRDHIRKHYGDDRWQEVQAVIYGERMGDARLMPGVSSFLSLCSKNNFKVYIVSHKTEFSNYYGDGYSFRQAAMDWMERNGFFKADGFAIPRENVFFESTRQGKLRRIAELGCTHFIDDLEETFADAEFPAAVEKMLFDPHNEHSGLNGVRVFGSWDDINSYLFHLVETDQSIVSGLVGSRIISSKTIRRGRNSRIYLLNCESGNFVWKVYFADASGTSDRMLTEFFALQFLWDYGVRSIPRPISILERKHCAVYEYVEGVPINSAQITSGDVQAAADFLVGLHRLKVLGGCIPYASEAFFSVREIIENMELRYAKLAELPDAELHEFIGSEFYPSFKLVSEWCRKNLAKHNLGYSAVLDEKYRTLSPSDFGFHNALRRADGSVVFLDFEHFGWDDPAKMIADFLLHPDMNLSVEHKRQFADALLSYFPDPSLRRRLTILFPLFGLKWCLIMLNEFLPEHFLRRQFADSEILETEVKAAQLAKARGLLNQIIKNYSEFPYSE